MGKCLFLRKGETHTEPVTEPPLGTLAVGSVVKLNESGVPVEFYIAKHDYEIGLNGSGRTLLVRKDCYDYRQWGSIFNNTYASSYINSWLNNTYLKLLDTAVQEAVGKTMFYYTSIGEGYTVTTLERAVFLLSATELGKRNSYFKVEGSALPIANILQIAYEDGTAATQWTRSISTESTGYVCCLSDNGAVSSYSCMIVFGSRPVFTLPSTILVDKNGNIIA